MIEKFIDSYHQMRNDFINQCQEEIKKYTESLFRKYPKLEKFGLRGYVPFFNDGDACEFSMSENVMINEETSPYDAWDDEGSSLRKEYPSLESNLNKLLLIPEDIFQTLYGSHFEVWFYRNGDIISNEFLDHE